VIDYLPITAAFPPITKPLLRSDRQHRAPDRQLTDQVIGLGMPFLALLRG
jgi:hypothetical protein